MVPPTPLASLSSLADRFATIIHHRQGPYLTPGNHIVIQNLGCFLFGRFRLPIFTCDRIFSFGEIHFSGVFCPVVLGTLYLHATGIRVIFLRDFVFIFHHARIDLLQRLLSPPP